MPSNPWIEHVRAFAKANNISYGCAITEAKASYTKKEKPKPEPETFYIGELPLESDKDIIKSANKYMKEISLQNIKKLFKGIKDNDTLSETKQSVLLNYGDQYSNILKKLKKKNASDEIKEMKKKFEAKRLDLNMNVTKVANEIKQKIKS